jgi:hypothetical protein
VAIPGFTEEQTQTINRAAKAGALTTEQKREIISRVNEASKILAEEGLKKRSLEDVTGGLVGREEFEAVGGTIGSVVGAGTGLAVGTPTGPGAVSTGIIGGLVGGGLGSAGGSVAFDNVNNLLDFLGVIEQRPRTTGDTAVQAFEAAQEDIGFAGGAAVLGTAFRAGKPLFGKLVGVAGDETARLMDKARKAGLTVGAVDVAQGIRGRVVRGGAKVAGIFPWIGGSFRREAKTKAELVVNKINGILNTFAPTATMSTELGVDMFKAANNTVDEFNRVAGVLYDNFRKEALLHGAIVPTRLIKEQAQEILDLAARSEIILKDGTVLKTVPEDVVEYAEKIAGKTVPVRKQPSTFPSGRPKPSVTVPKQIAGLPEKIDVNQFDGLVRDLRELITLKETEGFDVKRLVGMKKAMEGALDEIQEPSVKEAYRTANRFFSDGIVTFQTPTAGQFTKVDKNLFRAGPEKTGSLNEDELTRVAVNLRSPKAIDDLTKLVGKESMGKVARLHVEGAWDRALILDTEGAIKGLDWDVFQKQLGLGKIGAGAKAERAATAKLLEVSGVSIKDFEELIEVASKIEVPDEVNRFIARRAALGGLRSAVGAATAAKLVGDSLLGSIGAGMLIRYMGTLVSDPRQLQLLRRSIAPTTPVALKRQQLGRIIEFVFDKLEAEEGVPTAFVGGA